MGRSPDILTEQQKDGQEQLLGWADRGPEGLPGVADVGVGFPSGRCTRWGTERQGEVSLNVRFTGSSQ